MHYAALHQTLRYGRTPVQSSVSAQKTTAELKGCAPGPDDWPGSVESTVSIQTNISGVLFGLHTSGLHILQSPARF